MNQNQHINDALQIAKIYFGVEDQTHMLKQIEDVEKGNYREYSVDVVCNMHLIKIADSGSGIF